MKKQCMAPQQQGGDHEKRTINHPISRDIS